MSRVLNVVSGQSTLEYKTPSSLLFGRGLVGLGADELTRQQYGGCPFLSFQNPATARTVPVNPNND